MKVRSILKWCLITLTSFLVVITCFVLLLLNGVREETSQAKESDSAENFRRSNLAISLKIGAEEYYKQHKKYPQLIELYPSPDMLLIDYLKSGVISYSVKKESFCVRYINSDQRSQMPDQKYSMGWNGKQYCSKKEHLRGVSEDWKADSFGFYIYDLH